MDSRDARRIRQVKYFGSKAEAERVARRYQEAGAPVVITYPGAVFGLTTRTWGTGSGGCATSSRAATDRPVGRLWVVDVRDVARVHAAVLQPARGARRYLAGGTFVRFADLVAGLGAVTCRPGCCCPRGGRSSLSSASCQSTSRWSSEGIYFNWCAARSDNTGTRTELGVAQRDLQVTLVDSVQWLFEQGHISRRQAGQLATA